MRPRAAMQSSGLAGPPCQAQGRVGSWPLEMIVGILVLRCGHQEECRESRRHDAGQTGPSFLGNAPRFELLFDPQKAEFVEAVCGGWAKIEEQDRIDAARGQSKSHEQAKEDSRQQLIASVNPATRLTVTLAQGAQVEGEAEAERRAHARLQEIKNDAQRKLVDRQKVANC